MASPPPQLWSDHVLAETGVDILQIIFSFLKPEDLASAAAVCPAWAEARRGLPTLQPAVLPEAGSLVTAWSLSSAGGLLAATFSSGRLKIWRLSSNELLTDIVTRPESACAAVRFHPNNDSLLALAYLSPTLLDIFDVGKGAIAGSFAPTLYPNHFHSSSREPEIEGMDVIITKDSILMVFGCVCSVIELHAIPWTVDDLVRSYFNPFFEGMYLQRSLMGELSAACFSSSGKYLATMGANYGHGDFDSEYQSLSVWNVATNALVYSNDTVAGDGYSAAIAWSEDEFFVTFAVGDTSIIARDVRAPADSAQVTTLLADAADQFLSHDISAHGSLIATLTNSGMLKINDVPTERTYPGARRVKFLRAPRTVALVYEDRIEIVRV